MTDTTTTTNGGKHFWADVSKKSSTWAAVAAAGSAVCAGVEEWDLGAAGDPKHAAVGLVFAALRAIVGLAQGKVGDPATAKFDKPAGGE